MSARTVAHAPRAAQLRLSPRLRRRLLLLALAVAALAAGWFGWLRDSSLVAVEQVEISGLTAPSAARIERAITAAAQDMTTLHVRPEIIEQAVAGFPVVDAIEVEADFPHTLRVRVIEHRPVALIQAGGDQVPVAADGTLLPDVEVRGTLPAVTVGALGGSGRLSDARARALVAVAGAAPPPLLERAERVVYEGDRGIVVQLRDGPELVFGDGSRPRAKWLAASAVLADESSRGAGYVDLRIPERPAAGGVGAETVQPLAPAGSGGAQPQAQSGAAAGGASAQGDPNPQAQVEAMGGG